VAADNFSNFVMGSYIGIGAIMYGFYWLVAYFTPGLLADDLGFLTYLIAPAEILLAALFLVILTRVFTQPPVEPIFLAWMPSIQIVLFSAR
jgi:hypothetical protein